MKPIFYIASLVLLLTGSIGATESIPSNQSSEHGHVEARRDDHVDGRHDQGPGSHEEHGEDDHDKVGTSAQQTLPRHVDDDGHAHEEQGDHDDEDHEPKHRDTHDHEHGDAGKHDENGLEGSQSAGNREEEDDDHGDEHAGEVHLRPEQIAALGIRAEPLLARPLGEILRAPGEIRINIYATAQVAPRISGQVTARHARLGESVAAGQALVTISSVEMAEAQGVVVVAAREWQRVRSLGRKVVGESRYIEAEIAHQQAKAKAVAFGMSDEQVDELLRAGAAKADGSFVLLSPREGTVVADDFVVGEVAQPGRTLFEVTDESVRWVEARFAPADAARVIIGDAVRVNTGDDWIPGRVTQIHHLLDETTRTRAVRIEVPDPKHRLHPGEFVEVAVETGEGEPVLALPEAAVLRSPDGDWQVFVVGDEPGAYEPVEVVRVYAAGGLAVIDGIAAGTKVVTQGSFFLASELAKGGFDPHNH